MKKMLEKLAHSGEADSDMHADAKMKVLHELRNMAMDMMGEKVRDRLPHEEMHGVEVMAPDKEGLEKGLDLAKKVIPTESRAASMGGSGHGQPDRSHALDPDADLSEDRLENPGEDQDDMDDDELDAMISELEAKRAARKSSY